MIQRGEHTRFAFEPRQAIGIASEGFGEKLDGDAPAQLLVGRLIDIAHPAGTQVGRDLLVGELGADHVFSEETGGANRIRATIASVRLSRSLAYLKKRELEHGKS